jgi:hypothetical protein
MSPETLILIDHAKEVIREAKGLIQQHAELTERRRELDARHFAFISEFDRLKRSAPTRPPA